LSCSFVSTVFSLPRRSALDNSAGERRAHFGPEPPLTTSQAAPQTGLSVLMNGNAAQTAGTAAPTSLSTLSNMTVEQRTRRQADLLDRERQARALAAAGMVAESVNQASWQPEAQAPPHSTAGASSTTELDAVNWNIMELGNMNLDDMDLDFAAMFDPANEAAHMQTEGSGWPSAATSTSDVSSSVSPTPLGGKPSPN